METHRDSLRFHLGFFRESLELFSKHTNPHSSNDSQRKQKHRRTQEKNHHFAKFFQKVWIVKIFKVSIERVLELLTE